MTIFFINPFLEAAGGDFESIATVTVGSGGASSIEFTSIPGTYQHLQLRGICMGTESSDWRAIRMTFNGVTTTTYARHVLGGTGSSVFASATTSQDRIEFGFAVASTNIPGAFICDILDYGNTSKSATVRVFSGAERNATPSQVEVSSGLWTSTDAISTITLTPVAVSSNNFRQHSTVALYGIKA